MLSYHRTHQDCFSWLELKSFISKAQPSVLLEWVGKAPKVPKVRPPPQCPTAASPALPTAQNTSPDLLLGCTHCKVNSSTWGSQWHRDGQQVYKQSCPLQGDPKTTVRVPFMPTPLRHGDVEGGGGRLTMLRISLHWLGTPEGFRYPFPEDTRMRHKTQNQRATGPAKRATFLSHCCFIQHLTRPPKLSLRDSFHTGFGTGRGTSKTWLLNSKALP